MEDRTALPSPNRLCRPQLQPQHGRRAVMQAASLWSRTAPWHCPRLSEIAATSALCRGPGSPRPPRHLHSGRGSSGGGGNNGGRATCSREAPGKAPSFPGRRGSSAGRGEASAGRAAPPSPVDIRARGQRLHATLEGTCRETGLPFAGPGALRQPSTVGGGHNRVASRLARPCLFVRVLSGSVRLRPV